MPGKKRERLCRPMYKAFPKGRGGGEFKNTTLSMQIENRLNILNHVGSSAFLPFGAVPLPAPLVRLRAQERRDGPRRQQGEPRRPPARIRLPRGVQGVQDAGGERQVHHVHRWVVLAPFANAKRESFPPKKKICGSKTRRVVADFGLVTALVPTTVLLMSLFVSAAIATIAAAGAAVTSP